jgi:multiple sugar transport system substrate-binding protein
MHSNEANDHPGRLSRRGFLGLATAGALTVSGATLLAACSPQQGTAPSGGAPAAPPAAAPTTKPAAAGAAAPTPVPTPEVNQIGQGSKTTVFWHGLGGADGKTMQQMLNDYAAAKGDTAVRSETYAWDVFYQKLPTSVVAKTPPDLSIMHDWGIRQFATQGIIQPADDIFFNSGLVPKDDFNQSLINTITVDGKTMAVPFDNHGWGLYYNTKLISDAGLDPNNLPKNGDEFLKWAFKLTTDENGKHPDESGFNPDKTKVWAIHPGWIRFTQPSTFWMFGGGIISDDGKKSMLDSEKTIAAAQYWWDLMYKHHVAPPAVPNATSANDLMKTNSLAFEWDGSWNLNFFKDNPDLAQNVKAARLNSLSPDGKQVAKIASHMLVVPTGVQGDALARAKDLIKWLSDNGKTWANSGQVPARLSVQQAPSVQEIWSVKAFAEEFKAVGRTDVPHIAASEIQTTWEQAVSGALANTTPVKEALSQGSKALQAVLDRSG